IVEIRLRRAPVPFGDDDVAFDALRARGRRRELALVDAVRPVGQHRRGALRAERVEHLHHVAAGLALLDAAQPGILRRRELAERRVQLARRLVAALMAGEAAAERIAALEEADVLALRLDGGADAGAALPGNSLAAGKLIIDAQ